MTVKMTHTYAVLQISDSAFEEISKLLTKAGYTDHLHVDNGAPIIDMHGIALADSHWSPYTDHRPPGSEK